VDLNLGHGARAIRMRHPLDLIDFGLALAPWPEVFARKKFAEAAHVQSYFPTEPMRRRRRFPLSLAGEGRGEGEEFVAVSIPRNAPGADDVTLRGSSSPFCLACTWHGEVSGTR
jgi:hypothetical protein